MGASSQLNSYYYLHSTDEKTDLKTSSDLLKCACLMVAEPSSLILAAQQSRGSFQCTNTHMTLKQILGSLKPLFLPCKARYQCLLHKAGRISACHMVGGGMRPIVYVVFVLQQSLHHYVLLCEFFKFAS